MSRRRRRRRRKATRRKSSVTRDFLGRLFFYENGDPKSGVRYKKCPKKKQLINASKTQKEAVAKASERCAFPNTHYRRRQNAFLSLFFFRTTTKARSVALSSFTEHKGYTHVGPVF